MKLITMGTSHGDPTAIRFSSSNTLEINDAIYIIEAGVPVNALYVRKHTHDFSRVRAIFITHMHDDHIGGLPSFIKSLIKYPKDPQHAHIFLPEEVEAPLRAWLAAMHLTDFDHLITFHKVNEGMVYQDENVKVAAFGTNHIHTQGDPITFSYLFEAEGKRFVYTGDLDRDFSDFPVRAIGCGVDLCACECTHYDVNVAVDRLKDLPINTLLFTHIWDSWSLPEGEKKLRELYAESYGDRCLVAHDGDEFVI